MMTNRKPPAPAPPIVLVFITTAREQTFKLDIHRGRNTDTLSRVLLHWAKLGGGGTIWDLHEIYIRADLMISKTLI